MSQLAAPRNSARGLLSPVIPMLMLAFCAAALLFAAFSGCTVPTRSRQGLVVTSFAPEPEGGERPALRIRFSRPVVAEGQVGSALPSPPVVIYPSIKLAASWADRQTLLVRPLGNLRPSTRYRIALTQKLAEQVETPSFSFVHQPVAVEGLTGEMDGYITPLPQLVLTFNQPVAARQVARRCRLRALGDRAEPVGPRIALQERGADATGPQVVVTTPAPLEQGRRYQLRCEGVTGAGGDAAMEEPWSRDLQVHPLFRITHFYPKGNDAPADEAKLEIRFATRVNLEKVRKALHIRPWARGLSQGWLDGSGTRFQAELHLQPSTRYTVGLAHGFVDIFGQALSLERGQVFTFQTGDARPRLQFETGIYAVEASSPGYSVWTRNLHGFELECARVPKARIVKLLTSDMDYDPWYTDSSNNGPINWQRLGLAARISRIRLPQAKNKWQLHSLKLHEMCVRPSAGQAAEQRASRSSKIGHGLFLAEVRSPEIKLDDNERYRYRPRPRVLANLTDLGLLLKAGTASGLIWVTHISDGRPVPGATVSIYTPRGREVFAGSTDHDGLLRLPGSGRLLGQNGKQRQLENEDESGDEMDSFRSQRLIAVVEKGDDMAIVDGNWSNGIQIWNFDVPVDRGGSAARRVRGFIETDRGIYRPGEAVHVKGLVREVHLGQQPRVPQRARVAVEVEDAKNAVIFTRRLQLTPFGGFAFDLPLSSAASLGDYHVTAKLFGQTFREQFHVEEFRPVTFELSQKTDARHSRVGRTVPVELSARYLFGAPVAEARVHWNVERRPHLLQFPAFSNYAFTDTAAEGQIFWWMRRDEDSRYGSFVSDGEGSTDGAGHFRFTFKDTARQLEGPQDYLVQATVTDATDQSVSKRSIVTAHRTSFYLGLHAQEFVQAVDMPFAVNLVAVSTDGKRRAAHATLSYIQTRQRCSYSGSYRSYATCKTGYQKIWTRAVEIPATGVATERILPKQPGEFVVRVDSTDERGQKVTASSSLFVLGKGEAFWSGDESDRMTLVASKASYRPGETARLVPRANLPGATALLTLERGGIIEARLLKLKSGAVEIPIREHYAPNVFASVALVRGRTGQGDRGRPRFLMGLADLKVSAERQRLKVEVRTEKESYRPGEAVQGSVRVTAAGKPVNAEVALSVADEGVLQLIAYQTPDPMTTFYAPWGLGVDTATTWNRIARLADPREHEGEEGGDGGSERKVRSRFLASAFWAPSLVTNAAGEVVFNFQAPDNLTAFRLMAVAADRGSRFGSNETRITVSKPLLLAPVLPRFLSPGDRAQVGVIVHNHTSAGGSAVVRIHTSGVELKGSQRTVKLNKDGSARVNFEIEAGWARQASFQFEARLGKHTDALKIVLPVERALTEERIGLRRGRLGDDAELGRTVGGDVELPLQWPVGLDLSESRLEASVDRLGLSELEQSLRYLVEYPYGCLEQTLSRFIPLTKVKDLAGSLGLRELQGARLNAFVRAGAEKVVRHQHANGHFSLWPSSETHPQLTAYALFGLDEARRAGVKVDTRALDQGRRALQSWTSSAGSTLARGGESGTLAMAAYVLARLGHPDTGLVARLFEARRGMPRYGQALLLRALKLGGGSPDEVKKLRGELVEAVATRGDVAMVAETEALPFYMSSNVRSTALVLSALLETDPHNPLLAKLAEGLKRSQRPSGAWRNTQDNLYALVALADYARAKAAGRVEVSITLDGKRLERRTLRGAQVLSVSLPLSGLRPGKLQLRTSGPAIYAVRLRQVRREPGATPQSRGFVVERSYRDPKSGEPLAQSTVRAGTLVLVRVVVKSQADRHYVAVVDPLPAGFEALNEKLATSQQTERSRQRERRPWWLRSATQWVHQELRDSRVLAFADRLPAGTHELEYLVRATLPGTFVAAPAHAEAMYEPEVNGRSAEMKLQVTK